eukprot:scaffold165120_cov33-Attheya_sp.AAC.1
MGASSLMTLLRPLYLETMSGTILTFVYGIASAALWEALVKASVVEHRNRESVDVVTSGVSQDVVVKAELQRGVS